VGGLLIAIVALGALIVQTSMAAAQVEDRMAKLQDRHERLSTEVADMSSPWRLASWARSAGMVVPERVVVLRVVSGPR
jgi:cell division protein FtsL